MWFLVVLDGITLRDQEGRPLEDLLSQPRRFALLSYLAVARPPGPHRRDRLTALFWPEKSHDRARHALCQAVYGLRQVLGEEVVRSRGTEELFVDERVLRSDVQAFWAALEEGDLARAVGLHRTPLLEYFHIREAGEFDRWLEDERRAITEAAFRAAKTLVHGCLSEGELEPALFWARTAGAIRPLSESATRWIMVLLAVTGRRVEALQVFRHYRERLQSELELDAGPSLRDLAQMIRNGGMVGGTELEGVFLSP